MLESVLVGQIFFIRALRFDNAFRRFFGIAFEIHAERARHKVPCHTRIKNETALFILVRGEHIVELFVEFGMLFLINVEFFCIHSEFFSHFALNFPDGNDIGVKSFFQYCADGAFSAAEITRERHLEICH